MHRLLEDATEEQRAAIQHRDGPAFVSACPGSGKCVGGNTIIPTDQGMLQIKQIPKYFPTRENRCLSGIVGGDAALSNFGRRQTSHWFDMGSAPALRVETDSGYMLLGTHEHPIVVLDVHGDFHFKVLRDLSVGDIAAVARATDLWGTKEIDLDLAYVLGLLVGDGYLSSLSNNIGLCRDHEGMETVFRQVMSDQFNVTRIGSHRTKDRFKSVTHSFSCRRTKETLRTLGLPMVRSPFRYVPEVVMQGTRAVVVSFLQGLFDTESHVSLHNWEYTTASVRLAREVQALLLNLGVRTSFSKKPVKTYPDNNYYRLQVSGESIKRYAEIGLLREHEVKLQRLRNAVAKPSNPNKDLVLGQGERIRRLRDRYLRYLPNYCGHEGGVEENGKVFRLARYYNGMRQPSHQAIERILKYVPDEDADAQHLRMLSNNFILDPIVRIDDVGKKHVFDFTVPKGHSFVGNGFINHNTRVLTYRIAYLIDQGVAPNHIIGITFTNKAANVMKERVKQLVDPAQARKVWLSTFHSFCVRLMKANPLFYDVRNDFGIADDSDAKQIATLAMANVLGKSEKEIRQEGDAGVVGHLRRWISAQKDLVLTPDDLRAQHDPPEHPVKFAKFIPFYQEYQRLLRQNNLMDFDDLIMQVVRKLRASHEQQEFFAQHMHYLMVDEYQDTNYAQFELIRLISHLRGNVLICGDTEQCLPGDAKIYTAEGLRRIESLSEGDAVVCGAGHGETTTQKIEKVIRRHHEGELVVVKTKGGQTIRATPEHCFFGRLPQNKDGKFYVYMMHKRGLGYRIGRCQSYNSQGDGTSAFGVVCRTRQEKADEAWILRVCDSKEESTEQEAMLAIKFGIPQVLFHPTGRNITLAQDGINRIYTAIDTESRARKALACLGLSIDHPHYTLVSGCNNVRKTVHFRMFGSAKDRKHHEWFFNSSDMDLFREAVKHELSAHRTHRRNRERWRIRNASADHDSALEEARNAANTLDARLDQQAYLTEEGTYQYMPVGNLFVGCRVPVVVNGKVTDDEVVEVYRENYSGVVYDLSIPKYRNYCAEGLLIHNSIYGWRGADISNSGRFYKTFPTAKTFLLQTNFRSVPGIADVANNVIENNERLHAKKIITHKQGGVGPLLVETENPEREAAFIISTIKDLVRGGKYGWRDFAVIYRIRSISRALEDAAVSNNIPYRVVGAINFYSRAHVKDILAYCRLLVYPHDDSAFTRVYNKPARGIGPANFSRFAAAAQQHESSLMKTMRQGHYRDVTTGAALSGFRKLKRLYRNLRGIGTDAAAPVIQHVIKHSGYHYFAENIKDTDRSDRLLEDLDELISAAAAFDETRRRGRDKGVAGFLDHALLMQRNDKDEDENVVTLMTAHAAKGLEFPCVFVCGAAEGVLPLFPRSDDGEEMTKEEVKQHYEEERRVFYVAVTRAEERLILTYPKMRRSKGGVHNCYRSQFCREAGDALGFVSMVDPDKPTQIGRTAGQYKPAPTNGRRRRRIPDGGADDIMLLRERKRNGTATPGDLTALAAEEARMRAVVEDA